MESNNLTVGRQALLVETARALSHEWNNYLNMLLLELRVLHRTIPAPQAEKIQALTQQGKAMASLTQQWQRSCTDPALAAPVNLAEIVAAVTQDHGWKTSGAQADLEWAGAGEDFSAAGPVEQIYALVACLLSSLVEARWERNQPGAPPCVRLARSANHVMLEIQEQSPGLILTEGLDVFDPYIPIVGLRLAAAQSLARRLNVDLQAEQAAGGWAFRAPFCSP